MENVEKGEDLIRGIEGIIDLDRETDIAPDDLKACRWLAGCSDEDLAEMADIIKRFTVIIFELYQRRGRNE